MDGLPIMGGRGMRVKDVPILPGTPRIVVHAFPIMGGVTVRSRRAKQRMVVHLPRCDRCRAERPTCNRINFEEGWVTLDVSRALREEIERR